jgi:hypothetical protein
MLAAATGGYLRVRQAAHAAEEGGLRGGCDTCGVPYGCLNPGVRCPRCRVALCRRCFHRACALEIAGHVLSAPLLLQRQRVCDGCAPDELREERFRSTHLRRMAGGELVRREGVSYFSDASQQVWLSLDVAGPALRWRSMQLQNNVPKESGAVPLSSVAAVSALSDPGAGGRTLLTVGAAAPPHPP